MKKLRTALLVGLAALFLGSPMAHAQDEEIGPEGEAPAPEPAAAPAAKPDKATAMRKLYKIIRAEPQINQVQNWAVKNYRLETSRINGMATRARVKAILPDIEGSFDNMVGNNFSNTRDGLFPILPSPAANPNPNNFKERVSGTNDSKTWRVRATWNLDRLVFNPEALDAKSLSSLQENLIREVTTMFFARRRILATLVISPPTDPEQYFYEIQRLEEMTATLDAFTGRKFSKKSWQWDDPSWLKKNAVKKKTGRRFFMPKKRYTAK